MLSDRVTGTLRLAVGRGAGSRTLRHLGLFLCLRAEKLPDPFDSGQGSESSRRFSRIRCFLRDLRRVAGSTSSAFDTSCMAKSRSKPQLVVIQPNMANAL